MDDFTIFATVLAVVLTSVGVTAVVFCNDQMEKVDAANIVIDETPLPRKIDVLKASKVLDDSDANTAETVDSDDFGSSHTQNTAQKNNNTAAGSNKRRSKRWSRVTERKADSKKKTTWFWRPKKSENMGYEI